MVRPGKPEQGNKTYPVAQVRQVMNLSDMAKHMSNHSSKYDKGDVMAVATQLTSCIREQLLLGNKVVLGDLGAFCVSLKSESANNAEEFSTSLIKKVKVRWEPSGEFEDLLNEVTFEYVGTRKAQADARKAEKEALNNAATIKPGEGADDEGGEAEGGDGNLE